MKISPFKAIRFDQRSWDFVNSNLTRISQGTDKVVRTGNILKFLNDQISNGTAKLDRIPGLYVLRTTTDAKTITSIVGEIDYNEKSVLFMNEEVQKTKLEKYKLLFAKYRIQTSPILTFFKDNIRVKNLVSDILSLTPTSSINMGNGVTYEIWWITDPLKLSSIKESLLDIKKLYIADGHHRFSIFNSLFSKLSARITLSITDSESIMLKSWHRVIVGEISQDWFRKISKLGSLQKIDNLKGEISDITIVFRNGESFILRLGNPGTRNLGKNIYEIVKEDVIKFGFGIVNYDEAVFPLPGDITVADSKKIFEFYKNGSVTIFVPKIGITDFFGLIENGKKLPATSTWFEPKVVDGFIVRKF